MILVAFSSEYDARHNINAYMAWTEGGFRNFIGGDERRRAQFISPAWTKSALAARIFALFFVLVAMVVS